MNILIQLSHPAHFHLYKNVAHNLIADGHKVFILIKSKDVLEDLLKESGLPYSNILQHAHRKSKWGILWDMLVRDMRILRFSRKNHIDLLTGSTVEVAQVSWLLGKHSINTGEDDAAVIPMFGKIGGPFIKTFLTPDVCDNGKLEPKSVKYASYHELAYLHPNHFTPDKNVVEKYFSADTPYFIIRLSGLNAYHDGGAGGINTAIAEQLIEMLKPHGRIYITAERELEPQFEPYRIRINPLDMHHVMAFADLYIGDSQTMAAESAVLGVPYVRFNSFVGRIGYLRELEEKYQLGYGILPSEPEKLYEVVETLLAMPNRKQLFEERRQTMLADKIDYAQFMTWFIEEYPQSKIEMKRQPEWQYNFR